MHATLLAASATLRPWVSTRRTQTGAAVSSSKAAHWLRVMCDSRTLPISRWMWRLVTVSVLARSPVGRDRRGRHRRGRQGRRRPRCPPTTAARQRGRAEPVPARASRPARGDTCPGSGVEAITGKPYKPTTQGKNERFHQTLFRYLDKQPLAETLAELQAQVDAFDRIYNTERPHQGLPGRVTPLTAWEATPKADAPRPKPDQPFYDLPLFEQSAATRDRPAPVPVPSDLPADTHSRS